jgi:peptidyl-prolyl cis-trans isomerase D
MRRIADGEDFGVVGAEVSGLDVADLSLSGVSREQLPVDLADAVFSAPIDTPIGPVQSPIGWHVIEVTDIAPSNTPSLDEVREELELELAQLQAFDEMIELSEDVQDVLGGGGTLGEAAARLDLPLRTIPAMDLGGLDESGMPVTDLPPQFIETVGATPEGSESELIEADDETFFIIRVDAIKPATLKPFETVRADVETAWRAEEKRTASQRTADAIAAQIDGGTPIAAVAEADRLMMQTTAPLTRSSQAENLPREFVDQLFEAEAGKSFVLMDGTGVIVAEVGEITVPNPAADSQNRDLLSDELVNAAQQDRLSELAVALRGRHTVEVNPEVFESPY